MLKLAEVESLKKSINKDGSGLLIIKWNELVLIKQGNIFHNIWKLVFQILLDKNKLDAIH
jgi:hypothetical protein